MATSASCPSGIFPQRTIVEINPGAASVANARPPVAPLSALRFPQPQSRRSLPVRLPPLTNQAVGTTLPTMAPPPRVQRHRRRQLMPQTLHLLPVPALEHLPALWDLSPAFRAPSKLSVLFRRSLRRHLTRFTAIVPALEAGSRQTALETIPMERVGVSSSIWIAGWASPLMSRQCSTISTAAATRRKRHTAAEKPSSPTPRMLHLQAC